MEVVDWRTHIPEEIRNDPDFKDTIDGMKETDLGAFVGTSLHAQRRMGSMVSVPNDKSTDVDRAAFKGKLYDAGVIPRPPESPDAYGDLKPEKIPDGYAWNEELSGKFRTMLHEHGASPEFAKAILGLYETTLEAGSVRMKTSQEEANTALKAEFGDKYDERKAQAQRLIPMIFKTQDDLDFFEETGMGDHPVFLGALMRLAPLAQQDSSFNQGMGGPGGGDGKVDPKDELAKIMNDTTHPMHEGYKRGDKKVMDHIDSIYRLKYGTGTEEVT